MRAAAALLLHVLSVHYLFVLFLVGLPCLVLGLYLRKRPLISRYFLPQSLIGVFVICLFGGILFPKLNEWYLKNHGMKGEAVIVHASQEAGWFSKMPEVRLVLKIEPEDGPAFIEAVTTDPPVEVINDLQVGDKLNILYAPQYTHDIAITDW